MASRYTYEQFQQAAQNSGLLGQFSQADLNMAQKYPDFGMSILTEKQNFANATTDEQRALANQRAEAIRASYGNYTGGKDGSGFTLTPLSPGSFTYEDAPSYTGTYDGNVSDLWNQQLNYGSFTYGDAPTYTNRWDDQIQSMIQDILNREDFSWSLDTDPLYPTYKKQYLREGQRASADAMAQASAASGGRPSSYAATAASQAGDYYATKLSDVAPTLYQQAYDQYLQDYNMDLSSLSALNAQEQLAYQAYLNELAQFNTDRSFAYGQYLDDYSRLESQLAAQQGQDAVDYNRYLDQMALEEQEREAQRQAQQQAYENAMSLYQLYGYVTPGMEDVLGIPSGTPTADQAYNQWYMDMQEREAQRAAAQGSGGGSGSSGGGGGDSKNSGGSGSVYQSMYDAGIRKEGDAYAWLLASGYNTTQAGNLAEYFTQWMDDNEDNSAGGTGTGGKITSEEELGTTARTLYNNMVRRLTSANAASFSNSIDAALNEGRITEDEADFILTALGF